MAKTKFKKKLSSMAENWDLAKEAGPGFSKFPDGTYKFQLQNAEIVESQSSGKLQVHREHLCIEGEQAGDALHDWLNLEHEVGLQIAMTWIEQMGHEIPDKPEQLEEVIANIAECAPIYTGRVKNTDDGFTNLRVTKLLEGEAEPIAEEAEEDEGEEAPSYSLEEFGELEAEEVYEIAEAYEIEGVKLSGKLTSKKRAAIIAALDEEGYFEEETEEDDEPEDSEESEETEEVEEAELAVGVRVAKNFDGEMYEGEIVAIPEDGMYEVEFDDGDEGTFPAEELELADSVEDEGEEDDEPSDEVEGEEDEGEEDGDEEGDGDEVSEDELISFCQSQDIEVSDDDDIDELIDKITGFAWDKGELLDEEVELLESIGATFEKPKPKKTGKKGKKK